MVKLPGAQDIRQAGQPRTSVLNVPRPDTSGLSALDQTGQQITRAAVRIQKRNDATDTTLAENEFVSEANREWQRRQVEDDPSRPEFADEWQGWLEQRAKERTSNLKVSEEAKTDFSIRLSSRVLAYRDKGYAAQLDAQRTKSKEAISLTINRVASDTLQNPDAMPGYLDEAEATVDRFSGTLTAQDERKAKREAVNTVVASTVEGYLGRGEIDKAREVVRRATGVPGEKANPALPTIFAEAEAEGVDPVVLSAIARLESNFDPNAKAKTSSAAGLFQFTNSTGTRFGLPSDARKASVQAQSRAAARLTAQNIESLKDSLGGEPTPGEVYLAHFLGAGDAVKVLAAGDDVPLANILPKRVLDANPFLKGWTVEKMTDWAGDKMAGAMTGLADEGQVAGRDFGDVIPVDDVVKLHKQINATEEKLVKEARKQREELMSIVAPTKARPDVDPVGVLVKQSPLVGETAARFASQVFDLDGGSTRQVESEGDRLLELQRKAQVPPGLVKLFSTDQAKQTVRRFESLKPDQAAVMFLDFKERMGKHWPRAYGELVEQGMPSGYSLMGVVADSGVDADAVAQTLNVREEDLRSNAGTVARTEEGDMLGALEEDVRDFFQVLTFGKENLQPAEGMLTALRKVALDRFRKTGDAASAREFASNLLNKRFDVLDSSTAQVLIPREAGVQAWQAEQALDGAQTEGKLKRFSPVMMDTARPDFLDREAVLQNAVRQGIWTTNEDGTGAVLLHQFPGGGTIPVRNARVERYEMLFDDMLELSEQRRISAPRGPMSPPETFSGLTPEIARQRMTEREDRAVAANGD